MIKSIRAWCWCGLHLVHRGLVPLVTAIECTFTDCILSLFDCSIFFLLVNPRNKVSWSSSHKKKRRKKKLLPVDRRLLYYMGYFSSNTEAFSQTFITLESPRCNSSHFLLNVKLWETFVVFFEGGGYITIYSNKTTAKYGIAYMHVNSLDEKY